MQICPWGVLGQRGKYNHFLFIRTLLNGNSYWSDGCDGLDDADWTHTGMFELAFRWYRYPFLGSNCKKKTILGREYWIGVFKPNVPNIETFIFGLSKFRHRLQPNFAHDKDHRVGLAYSSWVVQIGATPNESKIWRTAATAAILKVEK